MTQEWVCEGCGLMLRFAMKIEKATGRKEIASIDYHHHILCSALHNTPLGSSGCICEVVIKGGNR